MSMLFQYFSRHFLLYLKFKCDQSNWKKNIIPFFKLASFCVTHITSQIYFFHISCMKCDSIHFNIMSDIVWSCWSENREKTIIVCFCHIFIDWLVLSANFRSYIMACSSFHNNDLLKWVYTVYKWNAGSRQVFYVNKIFILNRFIILQTVLHLEGLWRENGAKHHKSPSNMIYRYIDFKMKLFRKLLRN